MDTADFEQATVRASRVADDWGKSLKSVGAQATALGTSLTKTLTLPIVGLGIGVTKLAMDFESAFAGVRKTVDATDPEFAAMAKAFRNLSKEIPISVNELARLGEAAGALGIPKEEIVDFSRVMALLGVTTNLTADQAAESIAQIQTIFQAAGKDTENFASALVHLGNNGASTEAAILELANRIASAGNAIGLTQADVLGFAAALANVGINAEAGGTAISKVFSDMSISVSKGGKDLDAFAGVAGKTTAEFSRLFKDDAAKAVQLFIEGLGRAKAAGGDLNLILEDLGFNEVRQARALRDLALSGDNLAQALDNSSEAWRKNSALSEEARERFKTTASQLTVMWNRIKDVGITLGDALRPSIEAVSKLLDKLIPALEKSAKVFSELPGPIQFTAVGLLAFVAAAGPALFVMGQLITAVGTVSAAFGAKGIATVLLGQKLSGLTSILGLLALKFAAVAAVGAAGWMFGTWVSGLGALGDAADTAGQRIDRFGQRALTLAEWSEFAWVQLSRLINGESYSDKDIMLAILSRRTAATQALAGATETAATRNATAQAAFAASMADLVLQMSNMQRSGASSADMLVKFGASASDAASRARTLGVDVSTVPPRVIELAKAYDQQQAAMGRAATAAAGKAHADDEAEKASKKLTKASEDLERQIDKERKAINALGLVTEQDVLEQMEEFQVLLKLATAAGVPYTAFITAVLPKLEDLAKQAKASGIKVADLADAIADGRAELAKLIPVLNPSLIRPFEYSLAAVSMGLRTVSVDTLIAAKDAAVLKNAYTTLGITSQADLQRLVVAARNAYNTIRNSGVASYEDIERARLALVETEDAAFGQTTVKMAHGLTLASTAFSVLAENAQGAMRTVSSAVQGGIAIMQTYATSAKTAAVAASAAWGVATLGISLAIGYIVNARGNAKNMREEIALMSEEIAALGGKPITANDLLSKDILPTSKRIHAALAEQLQGFRALKEEAGLLDDTMQKYGLSLNDLGSATERVARQSRILAIDIGRLESAGLSTSQITDALADDLNDLIGAALEAGTTLPASLQPFINELIRSGGLTENLARQLLGLAQVAPWKEMEEAAKKYGIEVEHLGTIFQQSKLDDSALELAAAWALFTDHGTDAAVVVEAMKDEVQELIDKALKLGLTIPDAMKPTVEAMLAAGVLFDENGNKLEDLGRIEFAAPIVSEFDLLIEKVSELIEALLGVKPALTGLSMPDVSVGGVGSRAASSAQSFEQGTNGRYVDLSAGAMAPGSAMARSIGAVDGGNMTIIMRRDGRDEARWLLPFISGARREFRLA